MKNIFWYLGFLSVMGFLYFPTGNTGLLGFFGFIPYFSTYKMDDERLDINSAKAGRNAFAFTVFFSSAVVAYSSLAGIKEIVGPAFAVLFGGNILVALISLFYYDRKGN